MDFLAFWDGLHCVYGVCLSLNKSTSYLSLCLSLNSFCDETSRTWASWSPETSCSTGTKTPTLTWRMAATCWAQALDPRLFRTRRLMIKIPKTPHCYFTTSQWEESHESFSLPLQMSPLKMFPWASLVAQWLRICLPMQGTQVRALGFSSFGAWAQ